MKKLFLLLCLIAFTLFGCKGEHVFHTYYKDIDTDTMEVMMWDTDSTPCYKVHFIDSTVVEKTKGYVGHGPIIVFFNPSKNMYYRQFPANNAWGNAIMEFDPYKYSAL